jgi:hypothetical protein
MAYKSTHYSTRPRRKGWSAPRWLALLQGSFYLLTGLWPIVHLPSFERVSGPKQDDWLVKTVGALITVIGAALLRAGVASQHRREAELLAVGSAGALAAVDMIYVAQRRISPIYLLDAAVELAFIAGWGAERMRARPID